MVDKLQNFDAIFFLFYIHTQTVTDAKSVIYTSWARSSTAERNPCKVEASGSKSGTRRLRYESPDGSIHNQTKHVKIKF